jgi:hypothetical protein
LSLPYHSGFTIGLVDEGPSSMVSEPRSWVQFSPSTQFFTARIPPSLVSAESTGTTTPEREQTAPTAATRTHEKKYWTIARDSIAPSISTRFYDWTDKEGTV